MKCLRNTTLTTVAPDQQNHQPKTLFGISITFIFPKPFYSLILFLQFNPLKISPQTQNQKIVQDFIDSMTTSDALRREEEILLSASIFDLPKGENKRSRGVLIEKKIDLLESLAGKVSNRRSRRWLNDRLLVELVPRLNAQEIRGLFAPPPWGDEVPLSPFCMTNVGEWDTFRSIDMNKEASVIEALKSSSRKKKSCVDAEKMAVLSAWHRVNCRTREALRRSFLSELIEDYEDCIRSFIKEPEDKDVLILHIQDPFHRLLLHGVCEFYDLVSATITRAKDGKPLKMTTIKKKKAGSAELPNITLLHFLKMSKEGMW